MIPLVNVTTTIRDHLGNPVAGAKVIAKLSAIDLYQHEYVYPVEQTYVADGAGLVTMSLFPNAIGEKNTLYNIKATDAAGDNTYLSTTAVVPNAATTLDAIAGSGPVTPQNTYVGSPIAIPFYDQLQKYQSYLKNFNTGARDYIFPDIAGTVLVAAAVLAPGLLASTNAAGTNIVGRTLQAPAAGITIANPAGIAGNPIFALANDLAALEGIALTGIAARTAADTWAVRTLTQPAAGITISNGDGVAGNPTMVLANDLGALEGLGSTGIAVRSAADTWVQRSIVQPAAGITISNGDGVAANPTLALANDLSALEGLGSTGLAARTATDTWAQRTLTGTANQISVANGDGVAGNPTLSLPSAVTMPGSLSVTTTLGVTGTSNLSNVAVTTPSGYGLTMTTAANAFTGMQIARTVNTPSSWDIYTPAGSTDLRLFANTADRLTLTNAGAATFTGAVTSTGTLTVNTGDIRAHVGANNLYSGITGGAGYIQAATDTGTALDLQFWTGVSTKATLLSGGNFRVGAGSGASLGGSGCVDVTSDIGVTSTNGIIVGSTRVASFTNNTISVGSPAASGAYAKFFNNGASTNSFQVGQGFASGSDNVALLLNNANAAMVFGVNGAEGMRLTSTGILLKTTTGNYRLTNGGADISTESAAFFDAAGLNAQVLIANGDGSGSNAAVLGFANKNASSNYMLGVQMVAAMTTATAGSEAQELRIGTQSAGAAVAERVRIGAGGGFLKASNSGTYDGAANAYHEFYTDNNAGNELVRFTAAGGTATNQYGLRVRLVGDPNNTGNYFISGYGNATERFTMRSNGGLANFSANNVNLSDRTMKNIWGVPGAQRALFRALEIETGGYIGGADHDLMFFTAQQVQTVYPELVTPFDSQGKLGIREHGIQMRAYKVIQEHDDELVALGSRLTKVEQHVGLVQ